MPSGPGDNPRMPDSAKPPPQRRDAPRPSRELAGKVRRVREALRRRRAA